MDAWNRYRILIPALGVTALLAYVSKGHEPEIVGARMAAPSLAAEDDSLPTGVTPAMVSKGKQLFTGPGLCIACHGPEGKGGAIGPNLTDAVWLAGSGDYSEIVRQVIDGTLPGKSKTGQIMPPRGGSTINEEQVRAVAAFVWTLSRKAK